MRPGESAYIAGVILVASTHSGPHFVYHYESEKLIEYLADLENDLFSDSGSDIDWSDSDEEAPSIPVALNLPTPVAFENEKPKKRVGIGHKARQAQFEGFSPPSSRGQDEPDRGLVFGYDASYLAEILSPPFPMANKRFELTVDDLVFLGIPVHVLPGGLWRRLKPAEAAKSLVDEKSVDGANLTTANSGVEPSPGETPDGGPDVENESISEVHDGSNKTAKDDASSREDSPLRMFHVVFVLNPPITEMVYVTDQLYHYVVSQFAKVLRNEQASKGYAWTEISNMMRLRDQILSKNEDMKTTAVSRALEEQSELARALKQMSIALSSLDIARVTINNRIRAFQIPIDVELSRIPLTFDQVAMEHVYPTTAKIPEKEIGENDFDSYGLLLLDEPDKILQQIRADADGPISAMIRTIQPTMSIQELAEKNHISLKQAVDPIYSLVYWRCARTIIPLHHRNVYAVSPLAPIRALKSLGREFYHRFPMLPPLQRILSALSTGKPQPYMYHIPSRDHQEVYMQALAWLMRENLVVHLQTFALVLITRKIKLTVNHEIEESTKGPASSRPTDSSTDNTTQLKRNHSDSNRSGSSAFDNEAHQESFIPDPVRASLLEKKWISKVAAGHPPERAALFYRLLKYFNGKDSLEQVALHENLSRAELRRFLNDFSENVVVYKHW